MRVVQQIGTGACVTVTVSVGGHSKAQYGGILATFIFLPFMRFYLDETIQLVDMIMALYGGLWIPLTNELQSATKFITHAQQTNFLR
jgi:hypothetical protein